MPIAAFNISPHYLFPLLSVVWSYDPDGWFSMGTLCRLENKGIGVLTSLETQHMELAEVVNIEIPEKACGHSSPRKSVEFIVRQWTLGDDPTIPPTWRSLYQVLRKLGLEELSQKIEEFLSSEFSLIMHDYMKNYTKHMYPTHLLGKREWKYISNGKRHINARLKLMLLASTRCSYSGRRPAKVLIAVAS